MRKKNNSMAIFGNKTEGVGAEEKGVAAPKKAKGTASKESALAQRMLIRPRITEKGYALNALDQYVFVVADNSTKQLVKRAVEEAYGVNVEDVHMSRLPAKKKRSSAQGRGGVKKSMKKAIVRIGKGQNIELFKAGV